MLNTGDTNTGPVNTTVVKVASLYQVNTGLVTVVLVAAKVAAVFAQTEVEPFTVISVATAIGLTVTVTALAFAALFSHLLAPLTVT
ncbi:hypothetical protein D3C85_904190 [compost metagenome]